jgi:hypothetical protein
MHAAPRLGDCKKKKCHAIFAAAKMAVIFLEKKNAKGVI